MKRLLPFLLFVCLTSFAGRGQLTLRRISIGLNAGGMNYLGDLNRQSMLGKLNMGYGATVRYLIDNRWSLRVDGAYGTVEGGNPDYIARRNLSFRSHIYEASLRVEFNFLPFSTAERQYRWTPYIFGGVGMFHFNPTAQYTNGSGEVVEVALQPLRTEGQGSNEYPDRQPYALTAPMMPFGVGFRVKPNDMLTFGVEYGFRKTWTDYLDDVSTTYVGSELLNRYHSDGEAALLADRSGEVVEGYVNAVGIERGDDSLDDWYAYLNAYVSFRLDKVFWFVGKKRCDMKH